MRSEGGDMTFADILTSESVFIWLGAILTVLMIPALWPVLRVLGLAVLAIVAVVALSLAQLMFDDEDDFGQRRQTP